jgi:hypothetical protein
MLFRFERGLALSSLASASAIVPLMHFDAFDAEMKNLMESSSRPRKARATSRANQQQEEEEEGRFRFCGLR